jgi:hypothetical protein
MPAWLETRHYSMEHLREDVVLPNRPTFLVFRRVCCVRGHEYHVALSFASFGQRLTNPEALMCPKPGCGRECAVVG